MDVTGLLVQELNGSFISCKDTIALCGFFGSVRRIKGHDLDYLIVLKPDPKKPSNFFHLQQTIKAFKSFMRKIASSRKTPVVAFPSFRFKIWVLSGQPSAIPIHLLIFPSHLHFLSWTKPYPRLREGILTTLQPAISDSQNIDDKFVPFPTTLDWYLGLFYETYILFHCSSLPRHVRFLEANDKLAYLLRHLPEESAHIPHKKKTFHFTQMDVERCFTKTASLMDQILRQNENYKAQ